MIWRKAILLLTALPALFSCGVRNPATGSGAADPLADFHGVFAGNAISNDGRRVKIRFDIQQNGSDFTGTYQCNAGNANCRNQISKGWVRGSIDATSFRVSLQDGSWCMYTLGTFYLREGDGDYTCYVGSMIVEQGAFELARVEPK